jgi:F0F1-type ATP synthase assembly protein I
MKFENSLDKNRTMIKGIGTVLTLVGFVGLILGVLGIFGKDLVALSPWALAILGLIFFGSGIGLLKRRKDTDEV